MQHLVLLVLSFVALAFSAKPLKTSPPDIVEPQFQKFIATYSKSYITDTEYAYRLAIFRQNLDRIDELNNASAEIGGASFGITKFSDLTVKEFRKFLGYVRPQKRDESVGIIEYESSVEVPQTFNWISVGKVTDVKDQGQCGSCWAFSATENIESVWMIAKGLTPATMLPLAPQQIVDCDKEDGGCNGGDTPTAYQYVISAGGLEPEKDYPYRAVDESCNFKAADVYAKITGWKYATTTKNEQQMVDATATVSPLSICVDAEPWQFYTGGIMTAAQCGTSLDHCVQITGYDLTGSTPHWSVRNSWGTNWGESGFIRLQYGKNTCGVAEEPTTAVA